MGLKRKISLESGRTHLSQSLNDPGHVHSRSSHMAKKSTFENHLAENTAILSQKQHKMQLNQQKSSILMISKFSWKYWEKVVPMHLVCPFLTLDRLWNRLQINFWTKSKKVSLLTFFVHTYTDAMQNILRQIYSHRVIQHPNQVQSRFNRFKQMTFHYYDIIIRPIDPKIEIDFDTHGFSPILLGSLCVHFSLLQKALERRCERLDFAKMIFKSRFFRHVG